MDSFFNDAMAARLQYVTFPLELVGVTLALIEVRFPQLATRLTRQIERLSTPLEAVRSGRSGALLERSLAALLSRVLKAGFYVLAAFYAIGLVRSLLGEAPLMDWLPGMIVGFLVSAVLVAILLVIVGVTVYFLVVGGSGFARRFAAGRAIGTLGLLIAGLGLLGELYQFLNQALG
ncbi:MAG: hypothetical protein AB7I04_01555 [Pseudomonadales bacterium]